jgi:RNA polymerase sigma-70 factor, ECF subfamily
VEAVLPRPEGLAVAGPAPAMAELYREHFRLVTGWVRGLAGSRADVDDLVQEVFTVALKRLPSYRGEAKLTTWLFGITRNVVRADRRRARWRRFWKSADDEVADTVAAPDRTPVEALEQRRLRERLDRALDGMSDRARTAFLLFEVEELPGEEIAERLGVKVSTLWVILHRARADLARRLEALEGKEPD